MTAYTVKKQNTAVSASTFSRKPTACCVVKRNIRQTDYLASAVDSLTGTTTSSSKMKKNVLTGLRRNYVSRGLRARSSVSLATGTNDCEIDHIDSAANVGPIPSTLPTVVERQPAKDYIRIAGARRSVSLLKLAHQQRDESDTECNTDDETVVSNDSIIRANSKEDHRSYTIKFQCYVKVVEIPNRHSYSSKQQKRMWNDCKSIRENAKRSRIEYEWEGPEWQNAPEEDEFCTLRNGMKVHPACFP